MVRFIVHPSEVLQCPSNFQMQPIVSHPNPDLPLLCSMGITNVLQRLVFDDRLLELLDEGDVVALEQDLAYNALANYLRLWEYGTDQCYASPRVCPSSRLRA